MSTLRTVFSGLGRALSRLTSAGSLGSDAVRPANPSHSAGAVRSADPAASPDELEASLRFIEAQRLAQWMHIAARTGERRRVSDYDLRHVRASEVLPGAAEAVAALLAEREDAHDAATRRTSERASATLAAARAVLTARADAAAVLAARIRRPIAEHIARRIAVVYLRPVSPRDPAPAPTA